MSEIENSTAQVVADLVKSLHKPEIATLEHDGVKVPFALIPKDGGIELRSVRTMVDEWRTHPVRREGTARLTDIESFCAWVNRFKSDETAIFADNTRTNPGLLAVIDYHDRINSDDGETGFTGLETARPSFCVHRGEYRFPLSDEWRSWTKHNGANNKFTQQDFAAFVEEHILDILAPPDLSNSADEPDKKLHEMISILGGRLASPQRMMELSRGLAIYENAKVINATNITSGEGNITFEEEHLGADGKKLEVPTMFLIGIPVFKNGPRYRIPVRLRYRKVGAAITWHYEMFKHDLVFDDAITDACNAAKEVTGLPLYVGFPEKAA